MRREIMSFPENVKIVQQNPLEQQIEDAVRRLRLLDQQRSQEPEKQRGLIDTVLEELSTALEELHVTTEELRQQNEELAETRQAVEVERQRYQDLFESAPDGYVVTDAEGVIQEVNRVAAVLFGVQHDFLIGKPLVVFVGAKGQKSFHDWLSQLHKDNLAAVSDREIVIQPRKGTAFPSAVTVARVVDQTGRVVGLRWLMRDVTRRVKAEEALRASEEKYRQLVENTNSIIMRIDAQGNIKFFNEFAQKFFGYAEEEILGRSILDTIVPRQQSSGHDLAATNQDIQQHPEQYVTNDNENIRKNGDRVWVAWTNKALFDEAGHLVELLCVGSDATERKLAEEALRESQKRSKLLTAKLLSIQEEERGRLARDLHDSLGSTLCTIKLALTNALRTIHDAPETQTVQMLETCVQLITNGVNEVRRIAADLRPSMVDDLGIKATIGWFCSEFQMILPNINIEQQLTIQDSEVPNHLKFVFYRIL
jgi:PAS domain S-box-containing protein